MSLLLVLLLCLFSTNAWAKLVNITIDDTSGDPRTGNAVAYIPTDRWNVGQDCPGCAAIVDRTKAYDGSWHDTSWYPPNDTTIQAKVPFKGVAVYVYAILELDPAIDGYLSTSDISFFIDQQRVGHYAQDFSPLPNGQPQTGQQYNALIYSNTTLDFTDHLLTIQVGNFTGVKTILELDYIVYTFDDGTSTTSAGTTAAGGQTGPASQATSNPTTGNTGSTTAPTNSPAGSTPAQTSSPAGSTPPTSTTPSDGDRTNNTDAASSNKSNTGAIAGGVVGGIVAAALIAALIFFLCRRRRRENKIDRQTTMTNSRYVSTVPTTAGLPIQYEIVPFEPSEGSSPPPTAGTRWNGNEKSSRYIHSSRPSGDTGDTTSQSQPPPSSTTGLFLHTPSQSQSDIVPPGPLTVTNPNPRIRKLPNIPTPETDTDREVALSLAAENQRLRALLVQSQPPPYQST